MRGLLARHGILVLLLCNMLILALRNGEQP
jgi:hypothetical protein